MNHSVHEHSLESGPKGLIIDVPGSSVFDLVIRFNSGFQFGPHNKYELSHFVEHLISDGNTDYPNPGQYKVEFEKQGAYRNAYTSSQVNGYVASGAIDELDRILQLEISGLGRPTFPEASFATELNNVREEINRFNGEPGNLCSINLATAMFPNEFERFATRLDQLDAINIDDVRDFYKRTHTAKNMRFYVAGPLNEHTDLILKRIDELACELNPGERLQPATALPAELNRPVWQHFGTESIYYDFDRYLPELSEPERDAGVMLRALLFAGYNSRIYGKSRERGLAYHIRGSITSEPNRSSFSVGGFVTKRTALELYELVVKEMQRVAVGELKQAELDAHYTMVRGSVLLGHQTSGDMLGWYISQYDMRGKIRDFDIFLDRLRAVTPQQVIDVAQKILAAGPLETSFTGNLSEAEAREFHQKVNNMWLKR